MGLCSLLQPTASAQAEWQRRVEAYFVELKIRPTNEVLYSLILYIMAHRTL